MQFVLLAAMG